MMQNFTSKLLCFFRKAFETYLFQHVVMPNFKKFEQSNELKLWKLLYISKSFMRNLYYYVIVLHYGRSNTIFHLIPFHAAFIKPTVSYSEFPWKVYSS